MNLCLLMYSKFPEECLQETRHVTNICWINEPQQYICLHISPSSVSLLFLGSPITNSSSTNPKPLKPMSNVITTKMPLATKQSEPSLWILLIHCLYLFPGIQLTQDCIKVILYIIPLLNVKLLYGAPRVSCRLLCLAIRSCHATHPRGTINIHELTHVIIIKTRH